jgi:trimeric autotransporter adhesin
MAQNYTRQSSFADGDTITASLFNNEFNQVVNAFSYSASSDSSTGHKHDGTTGQGGNIPQIGDIDFLNKIVVDSTNNRWGVFVEVGGSPVEQVRIQDGGIVPVTTNDIDLGTDALQFKDIFIDGTANIDSLVLSSGSTVTAILDEDDLVSDSATALATQQSIKAYVDAQVTAQDLDIVGDTGTDAIDLDSETLTFTGGTGITSVVTAGTVTHNIDSTVATLTGTQTLTNKTLTAPDINGGTIDEADITVGADKTLDVSAGTLTLADNQISGDKVEGGTIAAVTITAMTGTLQTAAQPNVTSLGTIASLVATTADINAGTIDGTVIGGTTAAAGSFTTGAFSSTLGVTGVSTLAAITATTGTFSENVEFNGLNPTVTYDFNGSGTVTSADALAYLKLGSGISTGVDISATPVVAPSWSAATGTVYADNKFRILAAKGNSTDASAVATAGSASGYGDTVVIGNVDVNGVDTKLITGLGINGELITLAGNATATGTLAVAGEITANGGIALGDNDKATFGSSDDLQIYHNANQSFIEDAGTGDLYIRAADNLRIQSYGDNEDMIKAVKDGAVTLYHNNAAKLATTATGIDISGTVTATGTSVFASLDISGDIDVDGTSNLDILDVDGAANFAADVTLADGADLITASAGTSNLRLGVNAGNSIVSGGNYNTVVGDEAGTAITTGDYSTFVGYAAGTAVTTGIQNTIIGGLSGDSLTTGSYNVALGMGALTNDDVGSRTTAIGYDALSAQNYATATDSHNTAVGYNAGKAVTTGINNTLIGGLAGDAITTANSNAAFGYGSLGANTTGAQNVALGSGALFNNTTASNNTAVGTNSLLANTTGHSNVALGTYALDANTTASNNTAVGYDALTANTTGASNVAVGHNALDANTEGQYNSALGGHALGGNTTGDNNISVGFNSSKNNTTGSDNVALGYVALSTNTTGSQNVAIGREALEKNTTASNNTAVGYQALEENTTSANNTAVGYAALTANTTGTGLVAVGANALDANTTASNNVGIGLNAAGGTTTGADNIAIGTNSLLANTTGGNNVSIGTYALNANTTGAQNVAVGRSAGDGLTTGDYNVLIGYDTGAHGTNLVTGSENVIIGALADPFTTDAVGANGIGYDISCAAGYTTVGNATDDIRAAHGVATWATVSDERYKKDIVDSTAGLSFINALRPRTFKYRTLGELPETFSAYEADSTEVFKNSETNHGFIAQEIKAAIDADASIKDGFRLWDDREDGSQEVAEAALIPVLVKAIQELTTQLDAALARITTLEGK